MNLADYFDSSEALPTTLGLPKNASIFGKIQVLGVSKNIQIDSSTLVIFGVNETRNSSNPGAAHSSDAIRQFLYSLSASNLKQPMVDLGNIKQTASPADTYMAVRDVVEYLVGKGATCIILGGTQEITWPLYLATAEHVVNPTVSVIDYTIDMGSNDGDFSSSCYIDKILKDGGDQLFALNVIGYQGYLVDSRHLDVLSARNYELSRLGFVRGAMSEIEPTLRDSHLISLDMGCIKQSDSPGVVYPSPNGFYSEEICQLARYSGVSSSAKVFGLFELNTLNDSFS
jgi:arginase family enzyme